MTRTSAHWKTKPGSFDTTHANQLFPSDNPYGIPVVTHTPLSSVPTWLAPYRARIRSKDMDLGDGAMHFFLDDYRFETVWSWPNRALLSLRKYETLTTLLTPDFSLYGDWPLTIQQWNVYRNRWCGAFWQAEGFTVIPTVSWSGPESYDFCFCGVAPFSPVALSTVGIRQAAPAIRGQFLDGFTAMITRLKPSLVLCYGKPFDAMGDLAALKVYPHRWQSIRQARKESARNAQGSK